MIDLGALKQNQGEPFATYLQCWRSLYSRYPHQLPKREKIDIFELKAIIFTMSLASMIIAEVILFPPIRLNRWIEGTIIVWKCKILVGEQSLKDHIIGLNQFGGDLTLICLLGVFYILRFGCTLRVGSFLLLDCVNSIGEMKGRLLALGTSMTPSLTTYLFLFQGLFLSFPLPRVSLLMRISPFLIATSLIW